MYSLKITRFFAKVIAVVFVFILILISARILQYSEEKYVCRHMARDIEDLLEPIGFDVVCISGGEPPHEGCERHMWVEINGIPIDSVYLLPFCPTIDHYPYNRCRFDDYQDYLDYYGKTDGQDRGKQ